MCWLPIYLGKLAPTTLPQCQLVSNTRSAGLSLSRSLSLWPSSLPLSLSLSLSLSVCVSRSLSLSRIKKFRDAQWVSIPPGVRTLLYETQEVCCTRCTTKRCFLLCSDDLFRSLSVFPSLSFSVSLSLPLLAPLLLSLLTLPRGFLVPLLLLTPPCLLSPVGHIAVCTAVCSAACRGTARHLRIPGLFA